MDQSRAATQQLRKWTNGRCHCHGRIGIGPSCWRNVFTPLVACKGEVSRPEARRCHHQLPSKPINRSLGLISKPHQNQKERERNRERNRVRGRTPRRRRKRRRRRRRRKRRRRRRREGAFGQKLRASRRFSGKPRVVNLG
ncbi:unnamed protein product [Microthlaspi erraticum]|uniref:Uncharacterized protein n=1 Tax=Microthlaspi erraticum TaxID=1685480 RepID=A0A6D2K2Y3_9BRAS|nr:unnamed protein product [Microthlaspi erraticum]